MRTDEIGRALTDYAVAASAIRYLRQKSDRLWDTSDENFRQTLGFSSDVKLFVPRPTKSHYSANS